MNLNRIIPGVDVAVGPGVAEHVARGAQENPAQMHQLAEGEIGQQDADEEQMDVKDGADALRNGRMKGHQSHGQLLGGVDVDLGEIAHHDAGEGDAEDQNQREIIRGERDVAHRGDDDAPHRQVDHGGEQHDAGQVDRRAGRTGTGGR